MVQLQKGENTAFESAHRRETNNFDDSCFTFLRSSPNYFDMTSTSDLMFTFKWKCVHAVMYRGELTFTPYKKRHPSTLRNN